MKELAQGIAKLDPAYWEEAINLCENLTDRAWLAKEIAELSLTQQRYDKVRKMTPHDFRCVWERNFLTKIPFDQIIEELP